MNNGYTKININGADVGIKFGLPSLEWIMEKAIEQPNTLFGKNNQIKNAGIAYVLYYGYKNNCLIKEVIPTLTFEHFMNEVEGADGNVEKTNALSDAIQVWAESRHIKKISEEQADVKKKDLAPVKLKRSATVV